MREQARWGAWTAIGAVALGAVIVGEVVGVLASWGALLWVR